ncbi:MAG TPA: ArgE/DapE family deacylase [Terriglobales bacterium]|nr:ArgE/DapE family deacylase [Terriglobales bacterium]
MNETIQKISTTIDSLRDEMTGFLARLVQFPSLSGREQPAQYFYAEKLQTLGLNPGILVSKKEELETHPAFCDDGVPFEDRINVVGRWQTASKKTPKKSVPHTLILNGHMDVVPTSKESLWSASPWSGDVQQGKLYGRGSCDMKAGLAANIFAIQALQSLGFKPAADVMIESVIGEESGGVGTLTTIVKGFRADAAIISEPTALHVCPVQSGALTFRIRVVGRAIHACMKPQGINAIEKFYLVLQAVQELERRRHVHYKNLLYEDATNIAPISFGVIHGGEWPSTVPDEVIVEGRFGVLPGETMDDARRSLIAAVARAIAVDPWLKAHPPEIDWIEGQFESGQTAVTDPIVESLLQCHAEVLGRTTITQGVTYGSDLRLFTNHGQVPAVLYGPGSVAQAHTVDEWVELRQVFAAAKVLAYIITQWCGGEFN